MNRERRHALYEIVGEIRGNEIEVRAQLMDETDEEARAELVKATSSLLDAAEYILTATEVDGKVTVIEVLGYANLLTVTTKK